MSTQQSADSTQSMFRDDGHRRLHCLLCAVCCVLSTGCIRQQLTIRSDPPGAQLVLNEKKFGTTPFSGPFLWYGSYHVILTKPGYDRFDERVLIKAPIYFWIPSDLVMELLPVPVKDNQELSFHLTPSQPLPEPVPPEPEPPSRPEQPPPTPEGGHGPPTSLSAEGGAGVETRKEGR